MSVRDLIPWSRGNNQAPTIYRGGEMDPFMSLHRDVNRLFDEVWADEVDINSNALDVHVSRVRARIGAARSVRIVTLRGVGYRLEAVTEASSP